MNRSVGDVAMSRPFFDVLSSLRVKLRGAVDESVLVNVVAQSGLFLYSVYYDRVTREHNR